MTAAPQERVRGAIVGSYELLERLGAGGMGEVWKAKDRLLDRLVALKFLSGPAPARHDLLHEARAASSLNHPNIVTIFQVGESDGETYLAMEYIEGTSLRRHLGTRSEMSEAFEISEQIVDGLASAHARGIIHRDLKPENIMIRDDGRVKLVDFGLAKRLALADDSTADTIPEAISQSGELIGTCSYMSPEQARGHRITTASDVFSLGIVMYEMMSGRHPFRHDAVLDTLNAIVRHDPPALTSARPEAPPKVGAIVSRALRKEPTERYSSAIEISEPLKSARKEWDHAAVAGTLAAPRQQAPWLRVIGGAALVAILGVGGWMASRSPGPVEAMAPAVRSIAVMPFRTTDQNSQLLAEELPEDLGGALTKAGFQVASRNAVLQMGASPDVRSAGAELSVDGILEGTVRAQGGVIRIYVELVSTRTGFQVWSNTFTADNEALIAGQSTIATDIANQVRAAAGGQR